MNILVTGGAGFIGSHLCLDLLEKKHRVFCLDNLSSGSFENIERLLPFRGFHFICESVQTMGQIYVDQIYHLASPASPMFYEKFPIETVEANIIGTKKVLELAQKIQAKVLFASTSEIYGDPQVHPQVETYFGNVNPVGKRSCYDESKRCGETLCSIFYERYGVDVRIVRIFNTFGENMRIDDGRVVSNFIVQALGRKPLTIYGNGSQTRSLQYVSDLVRGLQMVMNCEQNFGPINLGRPVECSILKLAQTISKIINPEEELWIDYRTLPTDDPIVRKPDISKAKALLGWEPTVSLEKGLEYTIKDFRGRLNL